ncbi:MAG: hypothetical protein CMJ65_09850, partial [Planctomycetaceae bacterium]|nr:hypothetical protein [Planctomycetaceae bacterium]
MLPLRHLDQEIRPGRLDHQGLRPLHQLHQGIQALPLRHLDHQARQVLHRGIQALRPLHQLRHLDQEIRLGRLDHQGLHQLRQLRQGIQALPLRHLDQEIRPGHPDHQGRPVLHRGIRPGRHPAGRPVREFRLGRLVLHRHRVRGLRDPGRHQARLRHQLLKSFRWDHLAGPEHRRQRIHPDRHPAVRLQDHPDRGIPPGRRPVVRHRLRDHPGRGIPPGR